MSNRRVRTVQRIALHVLPTTAPSNFRQSESHIVLPDLCDSTYDSTWSSTAGTVKFAKGRNKSGLCCKAENAMRRSNRCINEYTRVQARHVIKRPRHSFSTNLVGAEVFNAVGGNRLVGHDNCVHVLPQRDGDSQVHLLLEWFDEVAHTTTNTRKQTLQVLQTDMTAGVDH
jgi:hypothetical protein